MSYLLAVLPGLMAQLLSGAALLAGAITLTATRRPAEALPVFLDLLAAAGLLHLVGDPNWHNITTAAVIIGLRHLIGRGLQISAQSSGTGTQDRAGAGVAIARLLRLAWRR